MPRGEPFRETLANAYSLRADFDQRTFPAPRAKRAGPPPGGADPTLASAIGSSVGRTRLFPFRLTETAGTRNTLSTPKLLGNVIVHSLYFAYSTTGDPPPNSIEIGYATFPVTELNVALTVPRPYTVLTELIDHNNQISDDRGVGFPSDTLNSPQRGTRVPLGLIIQERECAVVVASVNPSIFTQAIFGYFNLTENLSFAAIAAYVPAP